MSFFLNCTLLVEDVSVPLPDGYLIFNVDFQGASRFPLLAHLVHPQPVPGAVQPLQVSGAYRFTAATVCRQACEYQTNATEDKHGVLFFLHALRA